MTKTYLVWHRDDGKAIGTLVRSKEAAMRAVLLKSGYIIEEV